VRLIPRYGKWEPALISLAFFGVNAIFASLSTTLTNTLNATGHIKTSLRLMMIWTVLTWVLTPLLIFRIGFNGVALASAMVATTSVITIYLVKRIVPIDVLPNITAPIVATGIMGAFIYALSPITATSPLRLVIVIISAAILYLTVMWVLTGWRLRQEYSVIKEILKRQ